MSAAARPWITRCVAPSTTSVGWISLCTMRPAGCLELRPCWKRSPESVWDDQVAVALGAAFNCAHAALPWLKRSRQARYVLLGSAFGLHGAAMNPAYAAVKAATRGFTKSLAREWGPHGITVNMIAPSALSEAGAAYFEQNPAFKEQFLRNIPMRRMGRPREDIGSAVVGLCGAEFGYVTAQTLMVDGGLFTAL